MTDEQFADYWDRLVHKKYGSADGQLSKDERIFYAANHFRGSIPRSGVIGYFENTECEVIRDAHEALAILVLPEALRLLQESQRIVLKGSPLPETGTVELFNYDLSEEEVASAMEELDRQVADVQEQLYLQDEPIFAALCRFADERNLYTELPSS